MPSGITDHRIDRLVNLLVRNATVVLPGPKIASEIGVSRSTIWEWIEKLRDLGVAVKGHPRTGYRLEKIPDVLMPSLIRSEIPSGQIGYRVIHYFRTESTNSVALSLSSSQAPHGSVVVAEEQTAGRGRMGRTWYSEKASGIYASIVLRPPLSPAAAPVLTLMIGIAAHDAIESSTGLNADIRWPNDVLIGGKKVCGILTEMKAELDRLHVVVLGIGINVNNSAMPHELESIGTSLAIEGGQRYSRLQILVELLRQVEAYYQALLNNGNSAIVKRWTTASSYAKGKRLSIKTGETAFAATTTGLAPNGALKVRLESGEERLLISGEVTEVK